MDRRMEKKKAIVAITAMIVKNNNDYTRKLRFLLEQWERNNQLIKTLISGGFNEMHQLVAAQELHEKNRRIWKLDRKGTFWEDDVCKMDNKRFKENLRVSRESFDKICEKSIEMTRRDTTMRPCIPLQKRVAIALYALGSSSEYRTVAHLFGVGRSTVGEIVLEFCQTVCRTFANYVSSYPPTPEEIERTVEGFKTLGFPQCYGALDGCHIEIQPKKEDAVDFYNYKGWYSTVLLAACDHKSRFTYINIGSAGRNNDSYIFEKSSLKRYHEASDIFKEHSERISNIDVPVLLIGDSAFRLSRYMMKPYPFKLDQPAVEKNFNYHLSKCRRVIENAFGQLKARYRKIGRGLEVEPRNCATIIKACCLLHNFLKNEEDNVNLSWIEESQAATVRIQPSSTTRVGDSDVDAKAIRDAIAFALYNGGELENEPVDNFSEFH